MNAHLSSLLLALGLLAAPFAQAHDPAEHAKEAAEAKKGADCSKMDHSKMDMNDPVAQALMAKCAKAGDAHQGHTKGEAAHSNSPAAAPAAAPKAEKSKKSKKAKKAKKAKPHDEHGAH